MPKIPYIHKNFSKGTKIIIAHAENIIEEFQAQGYDLTLRQIYYQFVARGLIPNRQSEYKRLGSIINDARMAGLIDWSAIVDRTRNVRANSHWDKPGDIVRDCVDAFQIDKWSNQPERVEVWIEKDALVGVIETVCRRNDVPYFSCRGYTSQSEMWGAGQRIINYGVPTTIIHLGDHDPSGIDMSRDILDRLVEFVQMESDDAPEIHRIALNMDQVDEHKPPPNPAKITDSRFESYKAKHGDESWELDALQPSVIEELIIQAINGHRDATLWEEAREIESKHVAELAKVAKSLGTKKRKKKKGDK